MNQFQQRFHLNSRIGRTSFFCRTKPPRPLRSALCSALLFLALSGLFLTGLDRISGDTSARQKESLENALWRGVTQYYALEGHYPETLSDLTEEYGIIYDSDTFFVDYQTSGANILPDITVIER